MAELLASLKALFVNCINHKYKNYKGQYNE